jgi:hypothetical protein
VTVTKSRWTSLQRFELQCGLPGGITRAMCAGAGGFREVGWPSRSVGHARCKHRETDKPIGKPVIVVPCGAAAAGRWPSPLHPPWPFLRSAETRDLRRGLRTAGWAFEDLPWCTAATGCPITRCLHGLRLLFEASTLYWPDPRSGNHRSSPTASPGIRLVRLSIDVPSEPGPLALPPSGRAGMPLPAHCRSRGFAPPQRMTVSQGRRLVASCCRSWGSSRLLAEPLLRAGQAGRRVHRHPRDAFRTPRRIPSPAAAPRHRGRCLLTVPPTSGHLPDRFRSRTETPDAPADSMGSGRPIARPTSTHHLQPPRQPKPPRASTGTDRAPACGPRSLPHPCE